MWHEPNARIREAIEEQTRAIERANNDAWRRHAASTSSGSAESTGAGGCLLILAGFGAVSWILYHWFPTFTLKTFIPVAASAVFLFVVGALAFTIIGAVLSVVVGTAWDVLRSVFGSGRR